MTSGSTEAWIYAGNCPICQCGLRRVRACTGGSEHGSLHGYILCDDCETMWLEPDVNSPHSFPDSESPACPVCEQPLFGSQARWATVEDLATIGWQDACIVEPTVERSVELSAERSVEPTTAPSPLEDWLDPDDLALDLDSPEPLTVQHHDQHGNHQSPQDQLAEVMPQLDRTDENSEPKPGC